MDPPWDKKQRFETKQIHTHLALYVVLLLKGSESQESKKEFSKCAGILRFAGFGGGRSCFCLALVGGVLLSSTVGSEPSPLAISTQGVLVVCGAGLAKELD